MTGSNSNKASVVEKDKAGRADTVKSERTRIPRLGCKISLTCAESQIVYFLNTLVELFLMYYIRYVCPTVQHQCIRVVQLAPVYEAGLEDLPLGGALVKRAGSDHYFSIKLNKEA